MDINSTAEAFQIAADRLNYYIAFSVIALIISSLSIYISLMYNKKQLKANHDWNRRSFTVSQVSAFGKELSCIRDDLDDLTSGGKVAIQSSNGQTIKYTVRLLQGSPLTEDEVHEWVCQHDKDGNQVPSKKGKNPPCQMTEHGEKFVNSILKFINIYEQIGIGLKNATLDEDVVKDALKHPIKNNFLFYARYIEHRRNDHGDENFGASFKWLYDHFWGEKPEEKRKGTDNI